MSKSVHRKGKPTTRIEPDTGRMYTAGPVLPVPESKSRGEIPTSVSGEHFWVMTGLWHISDPATAFDPGVQKHLDLENLLSIDGPGCFICEQVYTAELASSPCTGEPIRR